MHDAHANAEQFDRKTELSFKYLQVFTACCNSFAHGSNDVANSIGPYAGIYAVWQCTCVSSKSTVPVWILVVGGAGIVLGLATYGYKIMRVLGVKMTKLTNSRGARAVAGWCCAQSLLGLCRRQSSGFQPAARTIARRCPPAIAGYCVELSSAIVVIVGSRYGLPLSTTQWCAGCCCCCLPLAAAAWPCRATATPECQSLTSPLSGLCPQPGGRRDGRGASGGRHRPQAGELHHRQQARVQLEAAHQVLCWLGGHPGHCRPHLCRVHRPGRVRAVQD